MNETVPSGYADRFNGELCPTCGALPCDQTSEPDAAKTARIETALRSLQPRLIADDTKVFWLFPDGSHRGVTKGDADQINWLVDYAGRNWVEVKINGQ